METTGTTEKAAPGKTSLQRRSSFLNTRRGRLLINLGCVPLVLFCTLALIAMVSFTMFFRVPTYIIDKESYVAAGRLIVGVVTTVGLQTLATWALGLIAALFGLRVAAGQGAFVARRLAVVWRRVVVGAWAIVALRLGLIVVIVLGAIQIYTALFGFGLAWDTADELLTFLVHYPVLVILAIGVLLAQWLVGPFLRLRFSLALGMLAGVWTQDRDQRPWFALTLRLGSELAGMVALMWSFTITRILFGVLFDPIGSNALGQYLDFFPTLPPRAASLATLVVVTAFVLVIHTALQIVLTRLALDTARRRLAHPKPVTFYTKAGEMFRDLARASVPKGEAT